MKSKLFPLFSILILLTLFGTAATCNLCGITPTTESVSSTVAENEADDTSAQDTETQLQRSLKKKQLLHLRC